MTDTAIKWGSKWDRALDELRRLFGEGACIDADDIADGLHLRRGHGVVKLWDECDCRRDAVLAAHAIGMFNRR